MRPYFPPLLAGLALGAVIGAGVATLARAQVRDQFILEPHDALVAEAQGCNVSCEVEGTRRRCNVGDPACRSTCRTLPDCRLEGRAIQACAVLRASP